MKRRIWLSLVCAMASITSPLLAHASDYPSRPVKMVVPFPAGSITDVVARALSDEMARDLGKPFIIDNKPGANGIVGTREAVQAPADGYTIVIVGVTTAASNVSLFKKLPYSPTKDLAPIGGVAVTPYLLVGSHKTPGKTVADLFDYGKSNPEKLSYAYGSGSAQIFGAKLAHMGGIKMIHAPYKGGPQALTDVMGGQVDLTFTDFANGLQQARAGKVKIYGTSTLERFELAKDIPTLHESGAKGFDLTVWFGLMAPTGLPEAITQRLNASLDKALQSTALMERFQAQGLMPMPQSAQQFGQFVQSEITKWGSIIKEIGIEPQ